MYSEGLEVCFSTLILMFLHLKSHHLVQMESCLVIRFSEEWFTSVQRGMCDAYFKLGLSHLKVKELYVCCQVVDSTRFLLNLELKCLVFNTPFTSTCLNVV